MMVERVGEKTNWQDHRIYALDQFDIPQVDYIKIDVDGFETRVLAGAKETILKNKPVVVLEAEAGDTSGIDYCREHFNYDIVAWDSYNRNVVDPRHLRYDKDGANPRDGNVWRHEIAECS